MNFENTFGETLKKLREDKDLTLKEVAKHLKIDTSMLGKIEKNSRKPTKKLIELISKLFDVSEKDLTIAFLSDTVASQILYENEFTLEVLKAAEKKVKYMKAKKTSSK